MPRSPVRVGPGKSYVDSLLGKAKTRTEALRLLRRRLSDRVYAALLADEKATSQPAYALAPNTVQGPRGAGRAEVGHGGPTLERQRLTAHAHAAPHIYHFGTSTRQPLTLAHLADVRESARSLACTR